MFNFFFFFFFFFFDVVNMVLRGVLEHHAEWT